MTFDGEIDTTAWDAMSPSTRRVVLGYGVAAAAAAVLGPHAATQARHHTATPPILSVPAPPSWAEATYDAVLNPTAAVRRAAASGDDRAQDLSALRVVVDRAVRVSLASDYGALEQTLPNLIRYVEAAALRSEHAETIAPDELRHHRLTQQLVPQLLTREHRTSQLRALAMRCHLLP